MIVFRDRTDDYLNPRVSCRANLQLIVISNSSAPSPITLRYAKWIIHAVDRTGRIQDTLRRKIPDSSVSFCLSSSFYSSLSRLLIFEHPTFDGVVVEPLFRDGGDLKVRPPEKRSE